MLIVINFLASLNKNCLKRKVLLPSSKRPSSIVIKSVDEVKMINTLGYYSAVMSSFKI